MTTLLFQILNTVILLGILSLPIIIIILIRKRQALENRVQALEEEIILMKQETMT